MEEDKKQLIKNANIDKAKNKTLYCILLSIISILTYVGPLIEGNFDFGIIFEIITLIFIFKSRNSMSEYDEENSKKYTIISMLPIGWLLIYDLINLLLLSNSLAEIMISFLFYILQESFLIVNMIILSEIMKNLKKAENPEKYKESTDWFYENAEENNDYGINNKNSDYQENTYEANNENSNYGVNENIVERENNNIINENNSNETNEKIQMEEKRDDRK